MSPPATGHREREREVAGAEDGDRAERDLAHAQVGAWRGALGQGRIQGRFQEVAVADHLGEQAQLVHGAAALALEAGRRQAAFLAGAFDQQRAQVEDALGDRLQEACALFQGQGAIGLDGGIGQFAGAGQVGRRRQAEFGFQVLLLGGIVGADDAGAAAQDLVADDHFAADIHGGSPSWNWLGC